MIEPRYQSDRCTLYCADCLQVLPQLDAGSVDAVITDPPYGIGVTNMTLGNGINKIYRGFDDWDIKPSKELFIELERIAKLLFIWGGNYFADLLPPSRCWLVWNKMTGANSFSDCELAWTNLNHTVKMYTIPWIGNNAKDTIERHHPTQKPIKLMAWIITDYVYLNGLVLDPFMGSGTTGVAAMQLGRRFIGVEIEPKYYDIAERRIRAAEAQLTMF